MKFKFFMFILTVLDLFILILNFIYITFSSLSFENEESDHKKLRGERSIIAGHKKLSQIEVVLSSNYLRKNKLKSVKIFLSRLIFFVFLSDQRFFLIENKVFEIFRIFLGVFLGKKNG